MRWPNSGYLVQILNPYSTFEERASALSWCKTDDLDLIAIAHAIKNNKATENQIARWAIIASSMCLTRARRSEVRKRSVPFEWKFASSWISSGANFKAMRSIPMAKARKIKVFSDFLGESFIVLHGILSTSC